MPQLALLRGLEGPSTRCLLTALDIDELAAMSPQARRLDVRHAHVKLCDVCQKDLDEQLAIHAKGGPAKN